MKNLFDFDELMEYLKKNTQISRHSIRIYYTDKHRKTPSGLPEFQIKVSFQMVGQKTKKTNMYMGRGQQKDDVRSHTFWAIGYEFKKIYTEGDTLFDGMIDEDDFVYLY